MAMLRINYKRCGVPNALILHRAALMGMHHRLGYSQSRGMCALCAPLRPPTACVHKQ